MFKVIDDSCDRFELEFDNHNQPLLFSPEGATNEFVDLVMGGESASIAISISFRRVNTSELSDSLFVFENIAGDPIFPGPHKEGAVLGYDQSDFNPGEGLLSGFDHTKLEVTVGASREDSFVAKLLLTKTAK